MTMKLQMRREAVGACLIIFFTWQTLAEAASAGFLTLSGLRVSHGSLTPSFAPDIFNYEVSLDHSYATFGLTPELSPFPTNSGPSDKRRIWPIVRIEWNDKIGNTLPFASPASAHSQRPLPIDGHRVTASVILESPTMPETQNTYTINVSRKKNVFEPIVELTQLRVFNSTGFDLEVSKDNEVDDIMGDAFVAYVSPSSSGVTVRARCLEGNTAEVNGKAAADSDVYLAREAFHHRQLVDIRCSVRGGVLSGGAYAKTYMLSILPEYEKSAILPPELVIDGAGNRCVFEEDNMRYICPNPRTENGKARIISILDPTIRYTVESSSDLTAEGEKVVDVRLLNGRPSIPFSYGDYYLNIVGWAGHVTQSWPIHFTAAAALRGAHVRFIGWFLALTLSVLLAMLLCTLAASNAFGIGAPLGATEIAASSTFLLQFLCFAANFLKEGTALEGITDPLKWVTVFWPIPIVNSVWYDGTPLYKHIGEITNLTNALGCLFWCWAIVLSVAAIRALIQLKFMVFDRDRRSGTRRTFPHRMRFGHWESRAVHFFVFPACAAASMILLAPGVFTEKSDDVSAAGIAAAIFTIIFAWVWLGLNYAHVRKVVHNESVVWIWNSASVDDGTPEDETGYWVDVKCDQLNTHAVNRGLIARKVLSWKWSSTVADIDPVLISGDGARTVRNWRDRYEGDEGAVNSLLGADRMRVAKNASIVDVIRTRTPGSFCPGQRMVAGLLRTDWVDILLTYQGLTHLHNQVLADTKQSFTLPVTCKISQLQGPLAAGRFCFFFEGVRVPFIRIEESIFRIICGMCIGVCLALQMRTSGSGLSHSIFVSLAVCFALIGIGAFASLLYLAATIPFSRTMENVILCLILGAVTCSSFAFMGYSIAESAHPSLFAELFMWVTAAVCVLLAIYSTLVIFSLIVGIVCPPLEETKFLERLANCTLTIADHAEGWAVDLPAYSKKETRSIKAVCQKIVPGYKAGSKPRLLTSLIPTEEPAHLEFTVADVSRAALTSVLPQPLACLFAPSPTYLGYKSVNVGPKDNILDVVDKFITSGALTAGLAPSLTSDITSTLETHKRAERRPILSLAIIPPTDKSILVETPPADSDRSSATASTSSYDDGSSYSWSSSSSSRPSSSRTNEYSSSYFSRSQE